MLLHGLRSAEVLELNLDDVLFPEAQLRVRGKGNKIRFLPLAPETIQLLDHYLRVEQPYQCAGSFKAEAYGSVLFSRMHGDDPSALIGLPLIRLVQMLEAAGVEVV